MFSQTRCSDGNFYQRQYPILIVFQFKNVIYLSAYFVVLDFMGINLLKISSIVSKLSCREALHVFLNRRRIEHGFLQGLVQNRLYNPLLIVNINYISNNRIFINVNLSLILINRLTPCRVTQFYAHEIRPEFRIISGQFLGTFTFFYIYTKINYSNRENFSLLFLKELHSKKCTEHDMFWKMSISLFVFV